jgi:hypothetical protein
VILADLRELLDGGLTIATDDAEGRTAIRTVVQPDGDVVLWLARGSLAQDAAARDLVVRHRRQTEHRLRRALIPLRLAAAGPGAIWLLGSAATLLGDAATDLAWWYAAVTIAAWSGAIAAVRVRLRAFLADLLFRCVLR